jgi:hypothetical protein
MRILQSVNVIIEELNKPVRDAFNFSIIETNVAKRRALLATLSVDS